PALRYHDLNTFERALMALDTNFGLLTDPLTEQLSLHEDTRQMVYRRGPLVFAVNLHPTESYTNLRVPVPDAAPAYRVVLDTDASKFGGWGRAAPEAVYPVQPVPMYGRAQSLQIYLPSRSAQVLAPHSLL
ncbi:MAG: alpha amylase C-terminal domain-containing protein, partial [Armatimonadota bacterium]|nr:alpha amylase C-terminal domain-containing protein [Armatimonadota bacterium]